MHTQRFAVIIFTKNKEKKKKKKKEKKKKKKKKRRRRRRWRRKRRRRRRSRRRKKTREKTDATIQSCDPRSAHPQTRGNGLRVPLRIDGVAMKLAIASNRPLHQGQMSMLLQ